MVRSCNTISAVKGERMSNRRLPMRVSEEGVASVSALLSRMQRSAFQGRKVGEAFAAWKGMIDGASLICLGVAVSLASAGLWPLVTRLVEGGCGGAVCWE